MNVFVVDSNYHMIVAVDTFVVDYRYILYNMVIVFDVFVVYFDVLVDKELIWIVVDIVEYTFLVVCLFLDKLFVLVDHNNLEGLSKDNVLGAIDHHIMSGEVYDTLEIEYASTCLLIYDLFSPFAWR